MFFRNSIQFEIRIAMQLLRNQNYKGADRKSTGGQYELMENKLIKNYFLKSSLILLFCFVIMYLD